MSMMVVGECLPVEGVEGVEPGAVRMLAEGGVMTLVRSTQGGFYVPRDEAADLDPLDRMVIAARALWLYLVRCEVRGSISGRAEDDPRPIRVANGRGARRRVLRAPQVGWWMIRHGQGTGLRIPLHDDVTALLDVLGADALSFVRPVEEGRQRAWVCVGLPQWLDDLVEAELAELAELAEPSGSASAPGSQS